MKRAIRKITGIFWHNENGELVNDGSLPSGLRGNVSDCDLTHIDRINGIDVNDLIVEL